MCEKLTIQRWDLNWQPFEHESHSITTVPVNTEYWVLVFVTILNEFGQLGGSRADGKNKIL